MSVTRAYAEAFFEAMMTRDPQQIAPYVADDAEWLIVGPIELFPYCGQHLGKEAVLGAYGRMGPAPKSRNLPATMRSRTAKAPPRCRA
jgi:hypothetical protein